MNDLASLATSVATLEGRVLLHVQFETLMTLGASKDQESLRFTLLQNLPRLRALGIALAAQRDAREVTIMPGDLQ
jgi:hypothetical protein